MERKKKKAGPRCQALDMDGFRCKKKNASLYCYHGDGELYACSGPEPTWVAVHFCRDHAPESEGSKIKRGWLDGT
jgi:hypothetical protein